MINHVFVNQKTYDAIVQRLGYKPFNVQVNPHIEDNKAFITNKEILNSYKPIAKLGGDIDESASYLRRTRSYYEMGEKA